MPHIVTSPCQLDNVQRLYSGMTTLRKGQRTTNGSNTSEMQRGLRELAERARRVGLAKDLHRFALPGAVRACIFHRRCLESAERRGRPVILAGHHVLVAPGRDDACGGGAASKKHQYPESLYFHCC